jgi:hypothetical protein
VAVSDEQPSRRVLSRAVSHTMRKTDADIPTTQTHAKRRMNTDPLFLLVALSLVVVGER